MTLLPATSTPRPLPRKRESAEQRPRLSLAGAVPAQTADNGGSNSGHSPAIQTNKAPHARRKPIQMNEGQSDSRLAALARLDALRIELRRLAADIALGADIELLDLMRDEIGSYSRHKAAQEARTWAEQARLSIETGLMQLDRALHPST
ncbi:hypothetical protein F3J20_30200 [Paraburkholderia sp. Cy-641]|uniref:hypothetical protein n=1 Tax=Paraburkholderia sp. Cy-641 TaxID=2608337 RepID=UPI00196488C0|nr:hypothetical protein [Paraburkholderia sp. Cy-641]NIF81594.1 hypothetical protein [Paraburkholderia sp. Cy-641]